MTFARIAIKMMWEGLMEGISLMELLIR